MCNFLGRNCPDAPNSYTTPAVAIITFGDLYQKITFYCILGHLHF